MGKAIRRVIGSLLVVGLTVTNISPAASVSSKKPVMTFLYDYRGACDDLLFTEEEYQAGLECQIFVRTYPSKPKRTVKLQWWDNDLLGWETEATKKTNKKGMATLKINPICEGGGFCNGVYEYQIYVPKSGKYAALWSDYSFEIEFLPLGSGF